MEVFNDPHLRAREFIKTVEHPAGPIALMGSPIRMSESPVALKPPPLLGADTEAVLATELGLDSAAIAELRRQGVAGAVD